MGDRIKEMKQNNTDTFGSNRLYAWVLTGVAVFAMLLSYAFSYVYRLLCSPSALTVKPVENLSQATSIFFNTPYWSDQTYTPIVHNGTNGAHTVLADNVSLGELMYLSGDQTVGGGKTGDLMKQQDDSERNAVSIQQQQNERIIKIMFSTHVTTSNTLLKKGLVFKEAQGAAYVKTGEPNLVFFNLENKSDVAVTGVSLFTCLPEETTVYIDKIQCFCFDEMRIGPHEKVVLPMLFVVNKELELEPLLNEYNQLVLCYDFMVAH